MSRPKVHEASESEGEGEQLELFEAQCVVCVEVSDWYRAPAGEFAGKLVARCVVCRREQLV